MIVTAFRNFIQLTKLSETLSEVFEMYIHIDKKNLDLVPETNYLKNITHVKVYSLYKILNMKGKIYELQNIIKIK